MPPPKWSIAALVIVCLAFAPSAQVAPPQASSRSTPPNVHKLGPQVGSRVPDFTLVDQQGQPRSLTSLMGPQGLMLVFYRSADWCPYCKSQLAELQSRVSDLKENGLGLAAISFDPVPVLAGFTTRHAITFPLLSDPGSATIKRYGILNTTVPKSNRQAYGVPFSGTFVLNPQGVVTSRFFEQRYEERSTSGSILVRLGRNITTRGRRVSSQQIELTSFASDSSVTDGTRFSLVLEIRPAPDVHVYAPGVKGYRPITLSLETQPGVMIREAQYPPSDDFYFEPLNEHVPAFQRPFRIVQDIVIGASASTQALKGVTALTIKGVLNYQACDDKICFIPQTVPLSWTVALRAVDRERTKP